MLSELGTRRVRVGSFGGKELSATSDQPERDAIELASFGREELSAINYRRSARMERPRLGSFRREQSAVSDQLQREDETGEVSVGSFGRRGR